MFHFLEQLRKKPIAHRKRILFLTSTIITGIIFIIWFSTFNISSSVEEVDSAVVENQMKPIEEIKKSLNDFSKEAKKITDGVFGITGTTSEAGPVN